MFYGDDAVMTCRSRFFALASLAIVSTLAACGGADSATEPSTNPANQTIGGTYALRSIEGYALPYFIQQGASGALITAGTLTITDNGSWTETWMVTSNGASQVQSFGGGYTRAGASLTMYNSTTSRSYPGTIAGNMLTIGMDNEVFTR